MAILIAVTAVLRLDAPYFAITPGPAFDVIELIDIADTAIDPASGSLLLTTVRLRSIRVADAIRGLFDPTFELLSRSAIVPSGQTEEEAQLRSSEQMRRSQELAAAAALGHLGYDVKLSAAGARVSEIMTEAPARAVLRPGDVIVGADSAAVSRPEDLIDVVRSHRVGDEIVLRVKRGDEVAEVRARTIGRPEAPTEPIIGITLEAADLVELPLAISIDSRDIGGPSAGLMYALGIVELLDEDDLARGRRVAGTGEITVAGVVGPVGGIEQKIAAARSYEADMFLVPAAELSQACAHAGDMPVHAIANLAEAVRVLTDDGFAAQRDCP